ncbi:MAG: adenosylcobinamide-phosphate synthase CbiB [Actinomycetota bacterium]|nr:adenosylcobinamide-phosphate synthase CbiB [Actinomycetota bacterium]MDI6822006.1 adenosylcobinamide-phosphate synthase CbiB [Actinomycetota bacterium]
MVGKIILAFLLDLLLGDPPRVPHPVKAMGRLITSFEGLLRKFARGKGEYLAGFFLTFTVVSIAYVVALLVLILTNQISNWLKVIIEIYLLYTVLATKDLSREAICVSHLLSKDLDAARKRLSHLVGRDTENLGEKEILRATVESVAENITDGVIAPLFYAFLGGPALAIAYKAINTLDSMVGYGNDDYRRFGWSSARLDDLANFIPARITGFLFPIACLLLGKDARSCALIMLRDSRKHLSPNAGIPEAAMAGALGVRLGGVNFYQGISNFRPFMGNAKVEISLKHIREATAILYMVTFLSLLLGAVIYLAVG